MVSGDIMATNISAHHAASADGGWTASAMENDAARVRQAAAHGRTINLARPGMRILGPAKHAPSEAR